jgi:hypothetical protein
VANLGRRLEKLELIEGRKAPHFASFAAPPQMLVLIKHLDNARRELSGLEPIPLTEEEKAIEYAMNKQFLGETAPEYRQSRGWPSEQAQSTLDQMEAATREKIANYERSMGE